MELNSNTTLSQYALGDFGVDEINEGACLTFKSIFHKTLHLF